MLRELSLRSFRNFTHTDLSVPSAGLAIVGDNGHGKTNLLEAVSYFGLLRSVRGARDAEVIQFGAPAFHVRATLDAPARAAAMTVGYERTPKHKKVTVDGVEQTRLSDALGTLPSVCFSPVDVALVAGGPAERRHYLDVMLALSSPSYLAALQQYRGALRQRNAALRSAQRAGARTGDAHDARVSVWEPALARNGAVLAAQRQSWCAMHADSFAAICKAIGERLSVSMRYAASTLMAPDYDTAANAPELEASLAHAYARAMAEQRPNELRRGITLVGAHRDELQLMLGTRELRTFGSAGQQRTAAIALRMLECATLRDAIGATPLLLLDDPFAELDARRSSRILSLLQEAGVGQVLLAVPREEDIPDGFIKLERRQM
ncbi:MAG: DNA replication and repair protein RecF, partial [Gemmatimonadaceae bacterium]